MISKLKVLIAFAEYFVVERAFALLFVKRVFKPEENVVRAISSAYWKRKVMSRLNVKLVLKLAC